jgi:hypothetical protein
LQSLTKNSRKIYIPVSHMIDKAIWASHTHKQIWVHENRNFTIQNVLFGVFAELHNLLYISCRRRIDPFLLTLHRSHRIVSIHNNRDRKL